MTRFPGWRTMTAAQRHNAKMDAIFEGAKRRGEDSEDSEVTRVVFRKFKEGGDVIAIFPRLVGDYSPYTCSSYQHIGQHGSCDPRWLVGCTTLATPSEYADLKSELESIGYVLDVRTRITRDDLEARKATLAALDASQLWFSWNPLA